MSEPIELVHSNDEFLLEASNTIPAVWMSLFDEVDIKWKEYDWNEESRGRKAFPYLEVKAEVGIRRTIERREMFLKRLPEFFMEYYDAWLSFIQRYPTGTFSCQPCWVLILAKGTDDTDLLVQEVKKLLRTFRTDDEEDWTRLFNHANEGPFTPEETESIRQDLLIFEESLFNLFGCSYFGYDPTDWERLFKSRYGRGLMEWTQEILKQKIPIDIYLKK